MRQVRLAVRRVKTGGFFKKPFFYFGYFSVCLLVFLFAASPGLATLSVAGTGNVMVHSFLANGTESPFISHHGKPALESPDLKIVDNSAVAAVSVPNAISAQTLGTTLGSSSETYHDFIDDYTVQEGETLDSLAAKFSISKKTIALANDISTNASLKVGQQLVILPFDGVLYDVKSGDTLEQIAKTYKVAMEDIISDNSLENTTVYIGDSLLLRGATMPAKTAPSPVYLALPDSFFIYPLLCFKVTQGLHPRNAIDLASCTGQGSPVYAAAGGIVLRAGYDRIGGNRVTIQHANGVVTYYGHLGSMQVKPGQTVYQGQQIGTQGNTGFSTGSHLHFDVFGAPNFIAKKHGRGAIVNASQ